MLECSKNVFTEIPITLLELKIICQNSRKFEKLHVLHFLKTAIKPVKLN
jgi:hypothetical protein